MVNRQFKILCATGYPGMDALLQSEKCPNMNVVDICRSKADVRELIKKHDPEILLVADKLAGDDSIINMMIALKKAHPYLRIIYLAGGLDPKDQARKDALGALVLSGIFDIVTEKKINIDYVVDVIENPISYESVSYLAKSIVDGKTEAANAYGGLEWNDYGEYDELIEEHNNIFVFTSIKPGTGKSVVSTNVACALARFGVNKEGKQPRVALIEADLQTLSVGTMLGVVEDKYYNLGTALRSAASVFDRGNIIADDEKVKHVNTTIRNCFVEYSEQPNLRILSGSMLTPEEIDSLKVEPEYYSFILDAIRDDYDYIIVDLNSSVFHVTTFTLLQAAKICFYILNLDYNNVRNNIRYRATLEAFSISDKIKYVLNQNIENTPDFESFGVGIEPLIFTGDKIEKEFFHISVRIPSLPLSIQLNRQFEGVPASFDKDPEPVVDRFRLAILEIVKCFADPGKEYEKVYNRVNKKKVGFFAKIGSPFSGNKKKEEVKE